MRTPGTARRSAGPHQLPSRGDVARIRVSTALRDGELFAPMHWNSVFARQGKINALVEGRRDPLSGQPECKQTAVRVMPWQPGWQGELYSREAPELPGYVTWWRKAATGVQRFTLAADRPLLGGANESLQRTRLATAGGPERDAE